MLSFRYNTPLVLSYQIQHLTTWLVTSPKWCIVCNVVSTTPFQNHPPPFLKIPHPPFSPLPTLPTNSPFQVFLIEINTIINSMNTIHVKQHVGFFIFRFFLKYMLDDVNIYKIHARQCLNILAGKLFPSFKFFVLSKRILHT